MSQKTAKQARKDERRFNIFYGSSYDRGLDVLLFMWPQVLEKYPQATLHCCYGWDMFDKVTAGNPERQQWKASVVQMMSQKGVTDHGRVGQVELGKIRRSCGIWAYPTNFPEINCITALQAQKDGLVPVTVNYAALTETVQSGVKVDGDIKDLAVQEKYVEALLEMMGNKELWEAESKKAQEFAKNFTWENAAKGWVEEFKTPITETGVSVVTSTIRTGWWNIMAENLSKQTHKILEWIIIDDYKEDRTKIAEKYAKKYNLNIRYIRGDKSDPTYKHDYALIRANNKSWQEAKGELIVYLQDFIIIPERGIEHLVDIYRHNKNALIAPVDIYYFAKEANKDNKEDWWDGNTDIIDKFSWRNVRVENKGMRDTENPYDFEMNYGAVPKKILQDLNGWYEFLDDGLGFDNLDLSYRALKRGYRIIVDDTNIAKCINLWPIIGGTSENVLSRERTLNPPRWSWAKKQIENNKLPIVRDEKLDKTIRLPYTIPPEIEDKDCPKWIEDHLEEIVLGWEDLK